MNLRVPQGRLKTFYQTGAFKRPYRTQMILVTPCPMVETIGFISLSLRDYIECLLFMDDMVETIGFIILSLRDCILFNIVDRRSEPLGCK